jgi:hypothetical protein
MTRTLSLKDFLRRSSSRVAKVYHNSISNVIDLIFTGSERLQLGHALFGFFHTRDRPSPKTLSIGQNPENIVLGIHVSLRNRTEDLGRESLYVWWSIKTY